MGNLYAGDSDDDESAAMYDQEGPEVPPGGRVLGLLQDIGLGLVGAGEKPKSITGSREEEGVRRIGGKALSTVVAALYFIYSPALLRICLQVATAAQRCTIRALTISGRRSWDAQ